MTIEEGYTHDGFPYSARDILRNLTRLKGTCIVCGRVVVDNIMPEVSEAYIQCKCGEVVEAKNIIRWS